MFSPWQVPSAVQEQRELGQYLKLEEHLLKQGEGHCCSLSTTIPRF